VGTGDDIPLIAADLHKRFSDVASSPQHPLVSHFGHLPMLTSMFSLVGAYPQAHVFGLFVQSQKRALFITWTRLRYDQVKGKPSSLRLIERMFDQFKQSNKVGGEVKRRSWN
jgi:hypothetical protein